MSLKNKIAFSIMGTAAGIAAVKALNGGWEHITGQQPPDPNDPDVPVLQAMAWVVASGLLLAGAQVLVNRFGARHWQVKAKPLTLRVSNGPAV